MTKISFMTILSLAVSCGNLQRFSKSVSQTGPDWTPSEEPAVVEGQLAPLEQYRDCEDFRTTWEEQKEEYDKKRSSQQGDYAEAVVADAVSAPAESGNKSASTDGGSKQITNVQEKGIDEADLFKVNDAHVFVGSKSALNVLDRKSLSPLGTLPLNSLQEAQLYATSNRMIHVAQLTDRRTYTGSTRVRIYASSAGSMVKLEKEHSFQGQLVASRLAGSQLIIVLRSNADFRKTDRMSNTPCDRITKSVITQPYPSIALQEVVVLDTSSLDAKPHAVATHAAGDNIYMGQKNLYIFGSINARMEHAMRGSHMRSSQSHTLVTKVQFQGDSYKPEVVGRGLILGHVKDQWAFKEFGEANNLAVASTEGYVTSGKDEEETARNHLTILRQDGKDLKTLARVKPFGRNEDIRAVRYERSMAYVVTFKKTDPLFAFDISNPESPQELGELQIPGFSTYMHPVADGRMVGVGFNATDMGDFAWFQGLQISLFDTKDPKEMKRLDNKVIGERGSSSEVTANHHAFFFDDASKLMGIPVVELGKSERAADPSSHGDILNFSGALFYKVEDSKLSEVARLSHKDLIPATCASIMKAGSWWQNPLASSDISRITILDGRLLTVSRFGIKVHKNEAPYSEIDTKVFSKEPNKAECSAWDYGHID